MTETIRALIERYKQQDGVEFYGAASPGAISRIEEALSIKLPPKFREFLLAYGGGGQKTLPVSGICADESLWDNRGTVYGDTLLTREDFNLPSDFIVVLRDYDVDSIWCLDCSKMDGRSECPVVNFDNGYIQRTHKDFDEFLEDYLRLRIKE